MPTDVIFPGAAPADAPAPVYRIVVTGQRAVTHVHVDPAVVTERQRQETQEEVAARLAANPDADASPQTIIENVQTQARTETVCSCVLVDFEVQTGTDYHEGPPWHPLARGQADVDGVLEGAALAAAVLAAARGIAPRGVTL